MVPSAAVEPPALIRSRASISHQHRRPLRSPHRFLTHPMERGGHRFQARLWPILVGGAHSCYEPSCWQKDSLDGSRWRRNWVKVVGTYPVPIVRFPPSVVQIPLHVSSPPRVATWRAFEVPWGHLLYPLQKSSSVGEPACGSVLASLGPCPLGTCYSYQGRGLDFLQSGRLRKQTG
jgi:hypothetical protein